MSARGEAREEGDLRALDAIPTSQLDGDGRAGRRTASVLAGAPRSTEKRLGY